MALNQMNRLQEAKWYWQYTEAWFADEKANLSALDSFNDKMVLTGEIKTAFAVLVEKGIINGNNGNLNANDNLTRAEFVQIMLQIFGKN